MTIDITDEEETVEESSERLLSASDLADVPASLHDYFQVVAKVSPETIQAELASARRVSANKDGSVFAGFIEKVKHDGDLREGVRLRALRGGDYFAGMDAALANDTSMRGSLLFAAKLLGNDMLENISCLDDMNAVYFAVMVLRKNFGRPRM